MTGTIAGIACVIAVTITRHRNNSYRNQKGEAWRLPLFG
jgi:hypothetical protein